MLYACYYNEMSSLNQQKSRKHTKKWESMAHSQEKNRSSETLPKKKVTVDILEKDFKTSLKDTQETKGRCEESLKNDV